MKKILIFCLIISESITAQKALITVPVADLAGQPLSCFYKNKIPVQQAYDDLCYAGLGKLHYYACPRLHQAVLHEQVELIETRGPEVRIRIPHIYYQTYTNKKPQCDYWTLKKNIITTQELERKKVDIRKLPSPINYKQTNSLYDPQIVTLIAPFKSKEIGQILSVGTRLVQTPKQKTKSNVSVYIYDHKTKSIRTTSIPKSKIIVAKKTTPYESTQQFLAVLRNWARTIGTIPYVWGGCSITTAHATNKFECKQDQYNNAPITKITRPLKAQVKTGLDCSGLIARAAQIAGIPYFFKNSYTITTQLEQLDQTHKLQPGDIMWLSGHVLVIASNATLIEARHYDHGYGKIHEIPLSEQFKGVKSIADLEKIYFDGVPLSRLDSKGTVAQVYKNFKLLRLASAWK